MVPQKIIVHCLDTKNGVDVSVEEVNSWHKARGWAGIGYHWLISAPEGVIRAGRPPDMAGAHCEGQNSDSLGIALVGRDKFSEAQWQSLFGLIKACQNRWDIDNSLVCVHNEFASAKKQGKTCPNFSGALLREFMEKNSIEVVKANLLPTGGAKA